ncbi:MAG: DUF2871 domain-containing protein [Acutalibacteraceae bacterium]|nr:DUF2871 domain-containing protein [Acutalibacteraceae bacterium]
MKKSIWISFGYSIAAMVCGVFYREFTKFFNFTDKTTLSVTHVHLFLLGAVIFLIVALFNSKLQLDQTKLWKPFLIVYNIGLPFMVVMFLVRGIMQVVGFDGGAVISGIAGVSHITLGAGIVLFFIMLLQAVGKKQSYKNQAV